LAVVQAQRADAPHPLEMQIAAPARARPPIGDLTASLTAELRNRHKIGECGDIAVDYQ
jgi:hypothetical protein